MRWLANLCKLFSVPSLFLPKFRSESKNFAGSATPLWRLLVFLLALTKSTQRKNKNKKRNVHNIFIHRKLTVIVFVENLTYIAIYPSGLWENVVRDHFFIPLTRWVIWECIVDTESLQTPNVWEDCYTHLLHRVLRHLFRSHDFFSNFVFATGGKSIFSKWPFHEVEIRPTNIYY